MVHCIHSWRVALAVVMGLAFASCSRAPTDAQVRAEFSQEHPSFHVESVGVGEGDGSAAYFHIRYRVPGDSAVREDVWQYLDTGDKRWRVNHKETLAKRQ
jgi:hypothetical protein